MGADTDRAIYAMQAEICRGLAHPVRLEVVHVLGSGERAFGELAAQLHVTKSKLSQHLAVLRQTGIVTARRDGAHMLYRLKYPEIESACRCVAEVLASHLVEVRESTSALLRVVRGGRR